MTYVYSAYYNLKQYTYLHRTIDNYIMQNVINENSTNCEAVYSWTECVQRMMCALLHFTPILCTVCTICK